MATDLTTHYSCNNFVLLVVVPLPVRVVIWFNEKVAKWVFSLKQNKKSLLEEDSLQNEILFYLLSNTPWSVLLWYYSITENVLLYIYSWKHYT